jgi:hypothetical protein
VDTGGVDCCWAYVRPVTPPPPAFAHAFVFPLPARLLVMSALTHHLLAPVPGLLSLLPRWPPTLPALAPFPRLHPRPTPHQVRMNPEGKAGDAEHHTPDFMKAWLE